MCDETVIVREQAIFLGGPPLVKAATGEEVDAKPRRWRCACAHSGVVDHLAEDDEQALAMARDIVRHLHVRRRDGGKPSGEGAALRSD